jgi:hypothetical protein
VFDRRRAGVRLRRSGQGGLMRTLLRFFFLRRLLDQSRRHRRRSPWGYGGYGRRRPTYGWGHGRPRGRGQVRVTGCCLPIPLGMLAVAAIATRSLVARVRR